MVHKKEVEHFEQVQKLLASKWDEELLTKPSREYKLVELFAGAGGLAIGLEKAGLKSILLNEIDKAACQTLRFNRPEWNIIEGDISQVNFSCVTDEVDLLTGGFPCQAFSYAGKN